MDKASLPDHPAFKHFKGDLDRDEVDGKKVADFRKFIERAYAEESPERAAGEALLRDAGRILETRQSRTRPAVKAGGGRPRASGDPAPAQAGSNAGAADPKPLGEPFHNPYTFLPFPHKEPPRRKPTPLTADEVEPARYTGTLEVELVTLSPLLTCESTPASERDGHKTYRILAIGQDVIVPATGVRGSLRTLLTIITGGTLGYVDDEVWLCQGRDARLGPRGKSGPAGVPGDCFLARILEPGDRSRSGRVRLGMTRLVPAIQLERALQAGRLGELKAYRPQQREKPRAIWVDGDCTCASTGRDGAHRWQVKLSGRPVKPEGKKEAIFLDDGTDIHLLPELWMAYSGRNRHGDHPELCKDDLVWLEPSRPDLAVIAASADVASIQWARWGRRGERLVDAVPRHMLPDAMNPDGQVDEVTDLFGQVPLVKGAAEAFAARVRPENLVFFDAKNHRCVEPGVALAPLAPPHPGCAAFYRAWDGTPSGLDRISNTAMPLRGYKVYRTTGESGAGAPWRYSTQGVYREDGRLSDAPQRVNKTCDLLKPDQKGRVRFAVRSLTRRELALLLAAASVDWRLGGGKPLGLGWCRVTSVRVLDEDGKECWTLGRDRASDAPAVLPADLQQHLTPDDRQRLEAWQASQRPVARLRYPRAVVENWNRKQRGGHVWFARHAAPKKGGDEIPVGLQTLWVEGDLAQKAGGTQVRAQALPPFDPAHADSDVLRGYDLFSGDSDEYRRKEGNLRTFHRKLEPFAPDRQARPTDRSGGDRGQDSQSRRDERRRGR